MMAKKAIISGVIEIGKALSGNDDVKSFICGTYSDGTARSLPDAISGELLSPKQKKKLQDKKSKKKKKNKKKKYARIDL